MKCSLWFLGLVVCCVVAVARAEVVLKLCPDVCPPCKETRQCAYFSEETDYCKCCTFCLKTSGEICGGPNGIFGKCARDLFCDKSKSGRKGYGNPIGICRKPYDFPVNCPAIACFPGMCSKISCPFGFFSKPCGCCPSCAPGVGESCGKFIRCGDGLYCDDSPVPGYVKGTCKSLI